MRVILLGSNGMLGTACKRYFVEKKVDLICFDDKFTVNAYKAYKTKLEALKPDLIINCVGKIPQKCTNLSDYYEVNVVLPKLLSEIKGNVILVQASTDCVFEENNAWKSGSCNETTAIDDYGMSKSIGDKLITTHNNGYVIRASIIGFTPNFQSKGLLDWLARSKESLIYGYDDHIWNGVTTKAWAKFIYDTFVNSKKYKSLSRVTHLGVDNPVSKYALLKLVNDSFFLNANIVSKSVGRCDRSLVVDISLGTIEEQIRDLAND
ncbi:sugar nucleotide-binding protein [Salinivibrio kushneri]|uniref:sugar nucleotide-binding protein n=1 Tax=Salinivibrio kushneri TaxID=1908198 RepID=UPI0009889442|nr:sugar nucleotide-binding protein [Salinivibrio kushneri]OOE49846.1 hypothetical protein BZG12_15325 [Salinivibrio kushneri]